MRYLFYMKILFKSNKNIYLNLKKIKFLRSSQKFSDKILILK